jgi:hypothetical protein
VTVIRQGSPSDLLRDKQTEALPHASPPSSPPRGVPTDPTSRPLGTNRTNRGYRGCRVVSVWSCEPRSDSQWAVVNSARYSRGTLLWHGVVDRELTIVPPYVPKLVEETCNVGDEYYYLTGTSMFMTRQSCRYHRLRGFDPVRH